MERLPVYHPALMMGRRRLTGEVALEEVAAMTLILAAAVGVDSHGGIGSAEDVGVHSAIIGDDGIGSQSNPTTLGTTMNHHVVLTVFDYAATASIVTNEMQILLMLG
jgi:hypothetical protein